jgi:hypothetical protein
VNPCE